MTKETTTLQQFLVTFTPEEAERCEACGSFINRSLLDNCFYTVFTLVNGLSRLAPATVLRMHLFTSETYLTCCEKVERKMPAAGVGGLDENSFRSGLEREEESTYLDIKTCQCVLAVCKCSPRPPCKNRMPSACTALALLKLRLYKRYEKHSFE